MSKTFKVKFAVCRDGKNVDVVNVEDFEPYGHDQWEVIELEIPIRASVDNFEPTFKVKV